MTGSSQCHSIKASEGAGCPRRAATLLRSAGPVLALVSLCACSATSFVSTWKAPDAAPGDLRGAKVAAAVMVKSPSARHSAEDMLAKEITARGAQGIALYRLVPDADADEDKVRGILESEGVKGVVSLRPVDIHKQLVAVPAPSSSPYYGGYWGGYYAYGLNHPWDASAPVQTRVDTVVSVETLIYSLSQNRLLWSGQSKTTNPDDVDELVAEVAQAAAEEIAEAGGGVER